MQLCLLTPETPKPDWAHDYCPSMFREFFPFTLQDFTTCEIHSRKIPHLLKLWSPNSWNLTSDVIYGWDPPWSDDSGSFSFSRTRSLKLLIPKIVVYSNSRHLKWRNAEISKFTLKHVAFHDFGIFNAKRPSSVSSRFPVCRTPICRNVDVSHQMHVAFRDFRIFNTKVPVPCHQDSRYAEPRNTEISHLIILFTNREFEWLRVLTYTPSLWVLNSRSNLTAHTDHDEWSTLFLDVRVEDSSNS